MRSSQGSLRYKIAMAGGKMSRIKTTRLLLREPKLCDANWITDGLNNIAVAQNMLVPHPFNIDHAVDWLSKKRGPDGQKEIRLCIEHKDDGGVGIIGFRDLNGLGHLGYWLAEPFWGMGIMSEAAKQAVSWYFEHSVVDTITSGVFYNNMASLAVQHKLGFVETGRSFVYCPALATDIEHINTELTRDEFKAVKI